MCRSYANTTPFHIRNLSIHRFWWGAGVLEPIPTDTEGWTYTLAKFTWTIGLYPFPSTHQVWIMHFWNCRKIQCSLMYCYHLQFCVAAVGGYEFFISASPVPGSVRLIGWTFNKELPKSPKQPRERLEWASKRWQQLFFFFFGRAVWLVGS